MYEKKIDQWHMLNKTGAIIQRFIYNFLLWTYSEKLAPDPTAGQGPELLAIF